VEVVEHRAKARALLAYLADTATSTEAALGYEGLLLELDQLTEPGTLAPAPRWAGGRRDAYRAAGEHLTALADDSEQAFQVAVWRSELDGLWQREQAG
jgi:hypothetical protein